MTADGKSLLDVHSIAGGCLPVLVQYLPGSNIVTAPCRRVLLDLAVRSGATLRSAAIGDLGADAVAASFDEIHSFQVRHVAVQSTTWSCECGRRSRCSQVRLKGRCRQMISRSWQL